MTRLRKSFGPLWLTGVLAIWVRPVAAQSLSPVESNAPPVAVVTNEAAAGPDARQLFALGMIETGNDDRGVGGAGEVSRYQILPTVWKCYTKSSEYADPGEAVKVARQHWIFLAKYFKEKAGRDPDNFDMYVLWNTRFGYYASKGFSPLGISRVVQGRAERYVNLVFRKE
jgi:hypothetical protein